MKKLVFLCLAVIMALLPVACAPASARGPRSAAAAHAGAAGRAH